MTFIACSICCSICLTCLTNFLRLLGLAMIAANACSCLLRGFRATGAVIRGEGCLRLEGGALDLVLRAGGLLARTLDRVLSAGGCLGR